MNIEYMETELLVVKGIEKKYGLKKILKDVNLTVNKGEIVGIIGKRGEGKRLLLELISGCQFPDKGEIKYQGRIINGLSLKQRQKNGIENNLFPYKYCFLRRLKHAGHEPTVYQRLNEKLREYGYCKNNDELIRWTLLYFGLSELNHKSFYSFSGGQKQRYQMAELLITKPQLVILDEPFKSFDEFTIEAYIKILKDLSLTYSISFFISDRSSIFSNKSYLQSTLFTRGDI